MRRTNAGKRIGLFFSVAMAGGMSSVLNGQAAPSTQGLKGASQPAVTADPVDARQVDALIQKLGSDDANDRAAAQQQLVDLRESAVEKLTEAASDNEDPEIRSRAAAALAQIHRPTLNEPDLTKPSLITLHENQTPLDKILVSIGKQANARIVCPASGGGSTDVPVTIDADHKPYWEVLTDLCHRLNDGPFCPDQNEIGNNLVELFPDSRNWIVNAPHQIVGPYWIGVSGVYRNRAIDLLGPPKVHDDVSIKIRVFPEPRLAVVRLSDLVFSEAVDDLGNSMAIRNVHRDAVPLSHDPRTIDYTIESKLAYPEKPGTKIARLAGEISMVLAQDSYQYRVDSLLDNPKTANPFAQGSVVLKCTPVAADVFHIVLQCNRSGFTVDQWSAIANQLTDLSVQDAQGRKLILVNGGAKVVASPVGDTISLNATFFQTNRAHPGGMHAGPPAKLLWNVPGAFKSVTVPVLITDIPMP